MPVHTVHKFVQRLQLLNDISSIDIRISNVFNVQIVHFRKDCHDEEWINQRAFCRFKCADSLTVHRRRLHLLPPMEKADDDQEKHEANNSNEKPEPSSKYACHLCERRFPLGKKLTTHLLKVHQLGKAIGCARIRFVHLYQHIHSHQSCFTVIPCERMDYFVFKVN